MSAAGLAVAVLGTIAAPGARLLLRVRVARGRENPDRLAERFGMWPGPRPEGRLFWFHAASMGESIAILPVLDALADEGDPPSIVITTGTLTSARFLADRLPALAVGRAGGAAPNIIHLMVPLDVPAWVSRFLDTIRPDAAVLVDSEIWPNMIAACRRRRIPLALVNARLSARSAAGWRRVPRLAAELFGAFDAIWARSEEDGGRLSSLGGTVFVAGDLKADAPTLACDEAARAALDEALRGRPRWLAASTHPGEEELAAEVHALLRTRHPDLLTIVAPRHPERGAAIASLLGDAPRRSARQVPKPGDDFWVCDTIGELGLLYRLAPIVCMGRSLAGNAGGQNPLEPARLGCAIASGEAANFTDAVERLRANEALATVHDAASLAAWVAAMLDDRAARAAAGRRASKVASAPSDLARRTARMVIALKPQPASARPRRPPTSPPRFWDYGQGGATAFLLAPVGRVVAAATTSRARGAGVRVGVPVLCCGNATVGGAGKTTLVLDLVARLQASGHIPHVLTRGHGGQWGARHEVLCVDLVRHDASMVGDEAMLLAAAAPTWVSRDRVAGARAAIAAGADVLVMDDGLQNPGLAKDASFLVIDGPAGFGNGRALPAGPLREQPGRAASRCRAIVAIGDDTTGAVRALAGIAPTLSARLVQGPDIDRLAGRRVVAFAGIGRPGKFFEGLHASGVDLADTVAYPDHHPYTASDLAHLAHLAGSDRMLATTPKDATRLPPAFRARVVVVGVSLAWADRRLDTILDAVLGGFQAPRS